MTCSVDPIAIQETLARAAKWLTAKPSLCLLVLCLAVYLPGIIRLPAVDRTEVIYAETTRDMVARHVWLDPRYGDVVHPFRPIGTFWAQALSAKLAGADHARDIFVYRLPGMIAALLSVLALYWMTSLLIGQTTALIAAGLFAVAPLTVLVSNLAIAEGLSLLPATVAMLSLLRIYLAPREDDMRRMDLLFWAALGLGVMINALLVPILVTVTLLALYAIDRDLSWLKRTYPLTGVPLALLIAAPWIIVRFLQDGVPFSGLSLSGLLHALGGAQDMKLRAWPGTFVLAAVLGFLPGTALIAPALLNLWNGRDAKIARFLLAWVIGYIVYLELVSSKPGTYMVQSMFPALAIAVAMLVTAEDGKAALPKYHAIPWPPVSALIALALLALPYGLTREHPQLWLAPLVLVTAAFFYWSAQEGRAVQLKDWAASSIVALGLFAVTLIGGILPSINKIWPAQQISRAVAQCDAAGVGLLGFTEPTGRFVLNQNAELSTPEGLGKLADGTMQGLAVMDQAWYEKSPQALKREQMKKIRPIACVRAINTMRGCTQTLTVVANTQAPPCPVPPEFSCTEEFLMQSYTPGILKNCN
jgi:4-amino-4-deoxy-L-arabinose transferase-like glycosyltransferase